jgi:hypothetical protein
LLVFEPGDQVTGWGRLVADADGQWLDLTRVHMLERPDRARRSPRSVRLIGADFHARPTWFGPGNAVPGFATITGIWLGDAIEVQSQTPAGPPPPAPPHWTTPPCPPPAGGWPRGDPHENPEFDLGDLLSSGAAVTVVIFRPSAEQTVLVVAAGDIDAVTTVLQPQLPSRLCIVTSRWTRAHLSEVHARFSEHWQDWALDTCGEGADEHAQAYIEVQLLRVTAELADWADTLPAGLLTLLPSLAPPP